jgi:hypothetical protein
MITNAHHLVLADWALRVPIAAAIALQFQLSRVTNATP